MAVLINYLERISSLNKELKGILQPYTQGDVLDQDTCGRLMSDLAHLDTLPSENPKIMLYGMYNAGKSTLLNALIGKEIAETGDFPVTMKTKSHPWNGYTIVDTPGIDVTGPEEKVTMEELTTSNVVIFVVCYGDIDHADLYERMEQVYKKGKKIIIALNCKEGIKEDVTANLRTQIMQNMNRQIGRTLEFVPFVVSAKHALLGKLEHSQKMLDYSRIEPLEKEILKVIRDVDGFTCFTNYLDELKGIFEPYQVKIQELQMDDKSLGDKVSIIDRNYRDFNNSLSGLVKGEIFSLSKRLFRIAVDNEQDTSCLSGRLNDEIKKFDEQTMEKVKEAIATYISDLADELGQVVTEFNANDSNSIKIDSSKVAELASTAKNKPDFGGSVNLDNTSLRPVHQKTQDNSSAVGDSITMLSTVIPKTLVTPPLGPIPPIPVGVIVAIAGQIYKLFAGSSNQHDDMVEAQVEAERTQQIEAAKMREQWRHEMKEQCDVISMDVEREEVMRAKEWVKSAIEPIRQQAKSILAEFQQNKAKLIEDNERINNWFNSVDNLISELRSR